jgi:serum/glucocorticoid-regulated kinase 2
MPFNIIDTIIRSFWTNQLTFIMQMKTVGQPNTPTKQLTLDSFLTVCVLGKGTYAKVLLVRRKDTGQLFAMKILNKKQVIERNQQKHVITERAVLEKMNNCPFLVSFYHAFQTPKKLCFILEYCPGGELFSLIQRQRRLNESQARFITCQIILGIEAMHNNKIIYRDLKPENVLICADGYVKITDFGLSRLGVVGDDVKSFCGTPEYLAPEVILHKSYGKGVDWWTLGCLLFEMVSGKPPFYKNDRDELFEGIKFENPNLPISLSKECRSLIVGLLNKDPAKRLGVHGAQEIKASSWFSGVNWSYLTSKKYDAPFKVKLGPSFGIENFDVCFTTLDPESPNKSETIEVQNHPLSDFTYNMETMSAEEKPKPVKQNCEMEIDSQENSPDKIN